MAHGNDLQTGYKEITGQCWEKWHAWRTDIWKTSHLYDEMSVKCNKQVTSKQEIRFSLTSINISIRRSY
jgi:hypothetical protein